MAAPSPALVRVVLVGSGYSAATTLRSLIELGAARKGEVHLEVEWPGLTLTLTPTLTPTKPYSYP